MSTKNNVRTFEQKIQDLEEHLVSLYQDIEETENHLFELQQERLMPLYKGKYIRYGTDFYTYMYVYMDFVSGNAEEHFEYFDSSNFRYKYTIQGVEISSCLDSNSDRKSVTYSNDKVIELGFNSTDELKALLKCRVLEISEDEFNKQLLEIKNNVYESVCKEIAEFKKNINK